MKKIIMMIFMAIALSITVYSVVFWEPGDIQLSFKTNDESIEAMSEVTEKNQKEKSVLKIDLDLIKDKISSEDRQKINLIKNKLSIIDLSRIEDEINKENEEEGIKNTLTILSRRLSEDDYNSIKIILEPYVEFSVI